MPSLITVILCTAAVSAFMWFWLPRPLAKILITAYLGLFVLTVLLGKLGIPIFAHFIFIYHPIVAVYLAILIAVIGALCRLWRVLFKGYGKGE